MNWFSTKVRWYYILYNYGIVLVWISKLHKESFLDQHLRTGITCNWVYLRERK